MLEFPNTLRLPKTKTSGQQWKYWVICEQFGSGGAMAYCIVEGGGLGACISVLLAGLLYK